MGNSVVVRTPGRGLLKRCFENSSLLPDVTGVMLLNEIFRRRPHEMRSSDNAVAQNEIFVEENDNSTSHNQPSSYQCRGPA